MATDTVKTSSSNT